ncbi:MAG: protein TolR [Gammaproteobacteria bacterium]|nr:MAG: protein TolR [Gammaproteobacteria bacterium]
MRPASGKRKPMSDINVVPYIDVMLVLLIIFMVTAPMLLQGVKVELPKVTSDPVSTSGNQEPLVISIDTNGAYYLAIGEERSKAIPLERVGEQVGKVLRQTPDIPVLVRGDKHVEYGSVVTLMATVQDAGAKSVGLITENP